MTSMHPLKAVTLIGSVAIVGAIIVLTLALIIKAIDAWLDGRKR